MKISEILVKSDKELLQEIQQLKRELMHLRFQKAAGGVSVTTRFGVIRRAVARLKTVLRQRCDVSDIKKGVMLNV